MISKGSKELFAWPPAGPRTSCAVCSSNESPAMRAAPPRSKTSNSTALSVSTSMPPRQARPVLPARHPGPDGTPHQPHCRSTNLKVDYKAGPAKHAAPPLLCRPRPALPARHPGHGPPHRAPGHALLEVVPRRKLPAGTPARPGVCVSRAGLCSCCGAHLGAKAVRRLFAGCALPSPPPPPPPPPPPHTHTHTPPTHPPTHPPPHPTPTPGCRSTTAPNCWPSTAPGTGSAPLAPGARAAGAGQGYGTRI